MDFDDRVETLLRQPCWLIDIFPVQVKEEFRSKAEKKTRIKQKKRK